MIYQRHTLNRFTVAVSRTCFARIQCSGNQITRKSHRISSHSFQEKDFVCVSIYAGGEDYPTPYFFLILSESRDESCQKKRTISGEIVVNVVCSLISWNLLHAFFIYGDSTGLYSAPFGNPEERVRPPRTHSIFLILYKHTLRVYNHKSVGRFALYV